MAESGGNTPFVDLYPMHDPVLCIIINQKTFSARGIEERKGTDKDRDELKKTFENLNGKVVIFENKTEVEIVQIVGDLVEPNGHYRLEQYSALIFCILSHGKEDKIMASDGRFMNIYDDFIYKLGSRTCPSLFDKPKIFIIQACQGIRRQSVVLHDGTGPQNNLEAFMRKVPMSLPENIDFIIGLSTIKKYVAFREPEHGSPFIQTLCTILQEFGHLERFNEILMKTRNTLATEQNDYGVTTYTGNTLRKNIIFKKKLFVD